MFDQLLSLHNSELKALQDEAQLFAKKYLDQACELGKDLEAIKEPLVKHLTQSFAFLCARARLEFIEAQNSLNKLLLKTIAPQLEYPLPSFAIIQFKLRKNSVQIPKNTKIVIKPNNAYPCEFLSCYATDTLPIEVKSINYTSLKNKSEFEINLKSTSSNNSIKKLRFYINHNLSTSLKIHQLIFENLEQLSLNHSGKEEKIKRPTHVGFNDNESLLPYEPHILRSHRLLHEFFNYPEKFLFFDLELEEETTIHDEFQLRFHFNKSDESLLSHINQNSLLLNCCPILNLYKQDSEVIRLNDSGTPYPLLINQSASITQSIYKIDQVIAINTRGERISAYPKFHSSFKSPRINEKIFWELTREKSNEQINYLIDLEISNKSTYRLIYCALWCCNKDHPEQKIDQQAKIFLKDNPAPDLEKIHLILEPSLYRESCISSDAKMLFIQLLNTNHLFSTENPLEALLGLFELYNLKKKPSLDQLVDSLTEIRINAEILSNSTIDLIFDETIKLPNSLFKTLIKKILNDYGF